MEYYVYAHLNPVNDSIFYIGKGKGDRAYSDEGRNKFWQNTVNKYGYSVRIIEKGLTNLQALEVEAGYIKQYGLRRDGGQLVNLTYGGRGGRTIYEHNIGSLREKCRESKLGDKNPNYGKKTWNFGKNLSDETRAKISEAKKGIKLSAEIKPKVLAGLKIAAQKSLESRTHKVRCLVTGKVWENRHECCKDLGIKLTAFKCRIGYNKEIKGNYLQLFK